MKSIIKTNQPEVGHGIGIFDPTNRKCKYAIVSCKYEDIGCEGMMERRNIATHDRNNDSFHLHLALDAVVELKGAVGDLEDSLKDAEDQLADLRCPSKTFALHGFEEKKEGNEIFTSPSFYTSHRGKVHTCLYTLDFLQKGMK